MAEFFEFGDGEWLEVLGCLNDTLDFTGSFKFKEQQPVKPRTPVQAFTTLDAFSATIRVEVAQDDTHTVVHLVRDDSVIATGRAKRRKGDTRDSELGLSLATMRAFRALAAREKEHLKRRGFEE